MVEDMDIKEGLARLLRPDRNVVMRLLEDEPLTVADILDHPVRPGPAVPPRPSAERAGGDDHSARGVG